MMTANKETKKQRWITFAQVFGHEVVTYEKTFNITLASYEQVKEFAEKAEFKQAIVVEALIRVGMSDAIAYYQQRGFTASKDKLANKYRWDNERKTYAQYTISETSDRLLERYAYEMGEYRSELLECLIRAGVFSKAEDYLLQLLDSKGL
jgi:hypothetical protein